MRPLKEKKMIVIVGPPGSGKTSLAYSYEGHIIFDNDRVIEAVWGSLQYHASIKRMAKGMVREGMRRAVEAGLAVVIPITGRTVKDRARIVSIGQKANYKVTIIKAVAPPEKCLERCKADETRPRSTNWAPIIERWFKTFEPIEEGECDGYEERVAKD